jgi:hypothetical protein
LIPWNAVRLAGAFLLSRPFGPKSALSAAATSERDFARKAKNQTARPRVDADCGFL